MPIKKLYIIGNGFDLHHHLKTSYLDFANFLKRNDIELYSKLELYISYPKEDKNLWSNFEENLANLDIDRIVDEHFGDLPNYSSEDFRDRDRFVFPNIMEEYYEIFTNGLFSHFQNFIQSIKFPDSLNNHRVLLDNNAFFLTFNYTNTLEKVYDINKNNIKYIHNSAIYGNEQIILGHGTDPKKFEEEIPEPPNDVDPEDYADWYNTNIYYDYSYDTGKDTLLQYFSTTFKPTKEIIKTNSNFFSKLDSVTEIFVLGHSLSNVDIPYFEEIIKKTPSNTKWFVSFYNSIEKQKHFDTLTNLGVNHKLITQFELEDIQLNNKQLKINF
ncbi:bacteriophage abortive infection AbiH family protein [Apibacter sp. HY039]|uniref:bacteriophage abortive infection AbiH family protein n=1 Tax=Apibacter sp. HY039 TaxID=2501476 RepID=UPI000FEB8632|nr:bacteriophage abortive infection AbiH family protein [Apibacter sp. HY039]